MKTVVGILKIVLLIGTLVLGSKPAKAQPADTLTFTAAEFFNAVTQYHPIVRLSSLLSQEAQQEVLQARGAFDPKLFSSYDKKQFGNTLYYDKWQSGLAVPILPGGIDLKITHDRFGGKYVNPEERLATPGLTSIGVSVPIGQGLLIDARRNTLRQAQLAIDLAEADRLKLINKTLFDAAKTYWDWFFAYQQFRLLDDGLRLADTRFRATRDRALLGDVAAIDTTEALITAQDRQVQREQSVVALQNTRLRLMAFLWNADRQPVELPERVVPQGALVGYLDEPVVQNLLNRAAELHPELTKLQTKERQLAIEERFRRSLLRPQFNVSASLLSGLPVFGEINGLPAYYGFRSTNYKVGLDFALPLFLRKERGKLQQVQIKAQQINLERQQVNRDIANDIRTAWNELKTLERQMQVQQQTVQNQQRLVQAEQQKFDMGESSLFLINTRETKLIDLQIKWEEMKSKYQKAIADLYYRAGTTP
ncbi:TolC family protein [Larkinella rosea]|uniref:TolC family protein n=1 Tax=Larkinella rosea TaxID=2025312 RepID=A0A3P1C263_9BACT|nr:TolC family protein [Larkinella rosea]RRB07358.1 TolC family protein [Larkinella rosea]